jgi:hypothetical protein
MKSFKLIILLPSLFLVSCISVKEKSEQLLAEPENGSAIYIYRPDSFSNIIISPSVFIDGKERFLIGNDKYSFVHVVPGKHTIKLNLDESYHGDFERLLDVKPDQTYFFRVDTSMKFVQGQPYVRKFNLDEVTKAVGVDEVGECRYMKPEMPSKYILKKSRPSKDSWFTTDKTSDPFSRKK